MLKEITNQFVEEGITREIQVKKGEVVLTTSKEGKDGKGCRNTYRYVYTMYDMFNKDILTIVTHNSETIVFNLNRCSVIANIPKLVKVECKQIINQTFIKIVEGKKQYIYDERSNLLETETKYDMEVIFGGRGLVIEKTNKKTGKSHCTELC